MAYGDLKVRNLIWNTGSGDNTVVLSTLLTGSSPAWTGTATGVNLTLSGNLTVSGTQTIINTSVLDVEDINITLGKVSSPSDTTANNGGITLKGSTDKTFNWLNATDSWTSSEHIEIASGKNLKVDGTTLFVDGTNNRVGIGSASPTYPLDLTGNSAGGFVVARINNTASNGYARILLDREGGSTGSADISYVPGVFFAIGPSANDTNTPIVLRNNNATERMRIDSSGNVGIGTTPGGTPAGKNVFLAIGDSDTGIVQDGDGQLELWANNTEVANINAIDGYTSTKPITTTGAVQTGDLTVLNATPDLKLQDSNHTGNSTEHTIYFKDSSGANQMNIGSPTGEQHLRIKHGSTDLIKIQTDGKVGIGTTSPDAPLTIHNSSDPEIRFGYSGTQDHRIAWDSSKVVIHADPDNQNNNSAVSIAVDGTTALTLDDSQNATFAGTVSDSKGNLRSIPLNLQSSTYTLVASDAGKHVRTSANVTIPNNVFAAGDAVTIINQHSNPITLTQASGVTLWNAADGSYGNRTLATRAMVSLIWTTASIAYISGAGLS